jgi:hypothetical protein
VVDGNVNRHVRQHHAVYGGAIESCCRGLLHAGLRPSGNRNDAERHARVGVRGETAGRLAQAERNYAHGSDAWDWLCVTMALAIVAGVLLGIAGVVRWVWEVVT